MQEDKEKKQEQNSSIQQNYQSQEEIPQSVLKTQNQINSQNQLSPINKDQNEKSTNIGQQQNQHQENNNNLNDIESPNDNVQYNQGLNHPYKVVEQQKIEEVKINSNNGVIQQTTLQTTTIEVSNDLQQNQENMNAKEIKEISEKNSIQQESQKEANQSFQKQQIQEGQQNLDQMQNTQNKSLAQNTGFQSQFSDGQKHKAMEKISNIAQYGSVRDEKIKEDKKYTIQELNQELHKEPYCAYSKVYCYGNCEGDQFKVELTREGQTQQYFQTRKPFEIKKFDEMKKKIIKLATGSMHSIVITEQGEVYTWGNNDSGQLGREGEQTTPLKVDLEEPVDLVGAGESFTILANSQSGTIYFFGKLKSPFKNLVQHRSPLVIKYGLFTKNKIQDIKCGQNHILILSNQRVYVWGDHSQGALGNQFRRDISRVDFERPTCINKRGVIKIFTNDFSSFIVVKKSGKQQKQAIYAFGLNNHNQLGFESEDENKGIELLPVKWTEISGDDIQDIQGGEHHTFVLFKNGDLYGTGKNDEGQLGDLDKDSECYGTFYKLSHLPFKVSKIICSSHFTYALDHEQKNYYAWGFGYDYVLANGKEDSLFQARKVNNERFFQLFPKLISFGTNFVSYVAGSLGQVGDLQNNLKTKKKRQYKGPKLNDNKKKLQH